MRRSEFRSAQRLGQKLVSRYFVLLLYARTEEPNQPARLGLVVSKRVGNAVVRNRAKRLLREAFRESPELWHSGVDFIFIARPTKESLTSEQLKNELHTLEQPIGRRIKRARRDAEIRQSRLAESS
jgi:ribonuclease P protein component